MRFSSPLFTGSAIIGSLIVGLMVSEVQCFSLMPRSALKQPVTTSTAFETTRSDPSSSSSSAVSPSQWQHVDLSWCLATALAFTVAASTAFVTATPDPCWAVAAGIDSGATSAANAKITTGGASTLQSGRTIAITRGVNLDGSDFHGQNLKGVAFQQSIVRDSNFEGSNLVGSSFFDATVGMCVL
jgi:uncharacterized protein YjbI with pentapeptide repeats